MKKLFLLAVLFAVSTGTLSVFGQQFKKLRSGDGSVAFQKTSSTTAVLNFENAYGYVVTRNLRLVSQDGDEKRWSCGSGEYVITSPALFITTPIPGHYLIEYYNALDRRLWGENVN
jgi:hypothetical protein